MHNVVTSATAFHVSIIQLLTHCWWNSIQLSAPMIWHIDGTASSLQSLFGIIPWKKWLMNLNSLFILEIFDTNCKGWQRHSTIERSYEYLIPRSLRDTLVMHTCDYSLSYNRQRCDTGQPGNIFPCQCVVKHGMYHLILISLYFGKSLKISVS